MSENLEAVSHAGHLTLPHYLRPGLRVAFVGHNPAIYSAEAGHYYARPGNVFWRQLSASGIAGSSAAVSSTPSSRASA